MTRYGCLLWTKPNFVQRIQYDEVSMPFVNIIMAQRLRFSSPWLMLYTVISIVTGICMWNPYALHWQIVWGIAYRFCHRKLLRLHLKNFGHGVPYVCFDVVKYMSVHLTISSISVPTPSVSIALISGLHYDIYNHRYLYLLFNCRWHGIHVFSIARL